MRDEFMCRCSDESSVKCDEVLAKARELCGPPAKDDLQFVNMMLYLLALDGDLSIMADQWGGIGYTLWTDDPEVNKVKGGPSYFVMCDNMIDGLACVYVWLQERSPTLLEGAAATRAEEILRKHGQLESAKIEPDVSA